MSRVPTPVGCRLLLSLVIGLPANLVVAAAGQPAAADTVAVTTRIDPVTASAIPSGVLVVASGRVPAVGPDCADSR